MLNKREISLDLSKLGTQSTTAKSTSEVIKLVTEKKGFVPKSDRVLAIIAESYIKDCTWYTREVTLKDGSKTLVFNLTPSDIDAIEEWLKGL